MEELGFTDILYLLQKCSPKDDKKTKSSEKSKLRGFLKTRWGMSYTKLRVYLRKKYFPTLLRKKYILIIKKSIFNDN
jgi:hypothetical protein